MAKRISITERIREKLIRAAGDDIDESKIAVFEAVSASTRPVDQKRSSYHGARLTENFLRQMASKLPDSQVTLQIMHNNNVLPVGKVFDAEVFSAEEGHYELNSLFYLQESSPYVEQIELAIIDEVSIGALPKHAFCSECGFDFIENPEAMYWGECENGHIIGEEGVHLRVTELEKWNELSLVNRGASSKAKILGSTKQRIGATEYTRLSASGAQPEALYLFTSATLPVKQKENDMSQEQLIQLSADKGRLESNVEHLKTKLELSDQKITGFEEKIQTLKTENEQLKLANLDSKVPELELSLTAEKEKTNKLLGVLTEQYKLACAASGAEIKDQPTAEEMVTAIDVAQIKLAAIPRGQQTRGSDDTEIELSQLNQNQNQHFVTPERK